MAAWNTESVDQPPIAGPSDTYVTDEGLEHLRELVQLQTLDLGFTRITSAGLEHIKACLNSKR